LITVQPKLERLGEISYNALGYKMKIIEYNNARNIIVQFEDGYTTKSEYACFSKGQILSPYNKRICGVGYIGKGEYSYYYKNNKPLQSYVIWSNMLTRCYSKNPCKTYASYIECSVHGSWHNFQNFAKWYDENFYQIGNEKISLDKDILVKGNKIYGPENCVFTPSRINNLFIKGNKIRGDYPIGVTCRDNNGRYNAFCNNIQGHRTSLSVFASPEEAFQAYKNFKEKIIKEVAEKYKFKIPTILYEALLKYEVEITD